MENMLQLEKNNIGNVMQNNIVNSISSEYVSNVHFRDVVMSDNTAKESDIYTETQKMGYSIGTRENIEAWSRKLSKRIKPSKTTTDILQQIVDEINAQEENELKNNIKKQISSLKLVLTAHPAFMKDSDGRYYRFEDNRYIFEPSVIEVDKEGNYTVKTIIGNGDDRLITKYNREHKPISFKILDERNTVYKSAKSVAKKLKMKQELVKKYKIHGYCGNAKGALAAIRNLFSDPRPTGYYFDKSYSFFKWNSAHEQFEVHERTGSMPGAPMISDYEFKEDVVVRTDYDGAGMNF